MGKRLRFSTEKDLQGKSTPRDLFHSLLTAAQVVREIYIAEKKEHRCSSKTIKFNFRDERHSIKRKIGQKSIVLEGGNFEDTTYIFKSGFLKRWRTDIGSSSSQNSGVKVDDVKKKSNANMINGPVQQNLKPEFLSRIQNMGGTDIKLVIEKELFNSVLLSVRTDSPFP